MPDAPGSTRPARAHDRARRRISGSGATSQRQHQRRQGREDQPPFDQPAQGEDHADDRHARHGRPVEPQAGQRHRAQHQRVARHDVFADHRRAAGRSRSRDGRPPPAPRRAALPVSAMDEGVDDDDAEARPEGIELGELLPRHAAQRCRAHRAAGRARRRAGSRGSSRDRAARSAGSAIQGSAWMLLYMPLARDDVDVLQPADQAAQHDQRQQRTPAASCQPAPVLVHSDACGRPGSRRLRARSSRSAGSRAPW